MYTTHPKIVAPSADAVLWRYMDLTKLVSLLDRKALHFARSDTFDDPFEGSVSAITQARRLSRYPNEPPLRVQRVRETISKAARSIFYVNCWHQNVAESPVLWKAYVREFDGIAVRTDFQSLCDSFSDCGHSIYAGKVAYKDYNTSDIPIEDAMLPYFYKRIAFQDENEVRAVCHVLPPQGGDVPDFYTRKYAVGEYRSVDLSLLIKQVVVSPFAEEWFSDLVKGVAVQYGLQAPVERSSLDVKPRY